MDKPKSKGDKKAVWSAEGRMNNKTVSWRCAACTYKKEMDNNKASFVNRQRTESAIYFHECKGTRWLFDHGTAAYIQPKVPTHILSLCLEATQVL
jgi:hypothetical protein